jgi:hypothetical protein
MAGGSGTDTGVASSALSAVGQYSLISTESEAAHLTSVRWGAGRSKAPSAESAILSGRKVPHPISQFFWGDACASHWR